MNVMAAPLLRFSKPVKRFDGSMSLSGARPTREPGGNTASAALKGVASASAAEIKAMQRGSMEATRIFGRRDRNPKVRLKIGRAPDAPQGQIDALHRKDGQRRCARHDAVDAVGGEPRRSAQHERVAGGEPDRPRGIAAVRPA